MFTDKPVISNGEPLLAVVENTSVFIVCITCNIFPPTPDASFAAVTAPSDILAVPIAPAAILPEVTSLAPILASDTALLPSCVPPTAPAAIFAFVTASSAI